MHIYIGMAFAMTMLSSCIANATKFLLLLLPRVLKQCVFVGDPFMWSQSFSLTYSDILSYSYAYQIYNTIENFA